MGERVGEAERLQGRFHPDSRWNVRPHLTAAGYLCPLKSEILTVTLLAPFARPQRSPVPEPISRRFKKLGKGWPTAFCRPLFVPAGDPHRAAFSSLLFPSLPFPDPSILPFSNPRVFSSFLFLSSLFSSRIHCILLWSRAQATSDAIFRRIGVYLVQPSRFASHRPRILNFFPYFHPGSFHRPFPSSFSREKNLFSEESRISEEDLSSWNKLNRIR